MNQPGSMSASDTAYALLGAKRSAAAVKSAISASSVLTPAERRSVLDSPADARRFGWLALSPHASRLRRNAYAVHAFEDDDVAAGRDGLELRDWFARTFACATPAHVPGQATPRAAFAAWRVFQERVNARFVYIAKARVHKGMQLAGFGALDGDGALVDGAHNGSVTHMEYAKMQSAIRAFVRSAVVLKPDLATTMDTGFLDNVQGQHTRTIVSSPFSALCGGAGVGKTAIVAVVVAAFKRAGVRVLCLAPTHKAKRNLAERLPDSVEVSTVDAFIRSKVAAGRKFIFVDEASMLSLEKTARAARAALDAGGQCQICLAGDDGQLEPIERGEVFRTVVANGGKHVLQLDKCYRTSSQELFDAYKAIRDGRVPANGTRFSMVLKQSDSDVECAVTAYANSVGAKVQFIAWTNRTCKLVNQLIQKREHGLCPGEGEFMVGDRVVYGGRNDPRKGLTNAMTGVVAAAVSGTVLSVSWETGVKLECAKRDVTLAYCITVHKAQGSQYPAVCVVATSVPSMMRALDRRWLYTAVSRAKDECRVYSTTDIAAFVAQTPTKRLPIGINFNV